MDKRKRDCRKKIKYENRFTAYAAITKYKKHNGTSLKVYICRTCHSYHLTSNKVDGEE